MRNAQFLPVLLVSLVLVSAWPVTTWAQSPSSARVEILGSAGAGPLWDDESLLGTGGVVGAGVGYRLSKPLGVEFLVDRREHDRRFASGVRFAADGWAASGRVLYYFSDRAIEPYVGGSVGTLWVVRTSEFPDQCGLHAAAQFRCLPVRHQQRTESARSVAGLAGVRIAMNEHLFLRPEVEVATAGEFLSIGGRIGVGWGW